VLALEMAAFWLSGKWAAVGSGIVPVISGSSLPVGNAGMGGPQYKSWLVNAADSDTLLTVLHDFEDNNDNPIAPDLVDIQPITSGALSTLANWGITVTPTQIILAKQPATGSGGTPAAKLVAMVPHTILQ
jgi:hypothetical protein